MVTGHCNKHIYFMFRSHISVDVLGSRSRPGKQLVAWDRSGGMDAPQALSSHPRVPISTVELGMVPLVQQIKSFVQHGGCFPREMRHLMRLLSTKRVPEENVSEKMFMLFNFLSCSGQAPAHCAVVSTSLCAGELLNFLSGPRRPSSFSGGSDPTPRCKTV